MSARRDAFVKKMKAKIDEWNAEIDKLEAKTRQKEADAQKDYQQRIEAMKNQRKTLEDNLDEMQASGENAWEDLKAGIENAADSLGEALRSAKSRF